MQAGELYRIRFSEGVKSLRGTRVGLLHGRTGVPLFLLYLEGIEHAIEYRCISLESLELFASRFSSSSDRETVYELRTFFEEGGAVMQIIASPLRSGSHRLETMRGKSIAYNQKTGLELLRNVGEYCDLVAVPQARRLLSAEESKIFHDEVIRVVSESNALFALLECPRLLEVKDAVLWAKDFASADAALYFPSMFFKGVETSLLPVIAACYQKTDSQKGIAELPTFNHLEADILPTVRLSPSQQMELLSGRINSLVLTPGTRGQLRVWGGHTLVRPPDMEFSLIPVRRTLRALREALESIAESYVLEPISADISLEVEHRIRSFLEEQRHLFDLYAKSPFDVSVSNLNGKDSEGIEINCSFKLSRCVRELKLNFGVSQE